MADNYVPLNGFSTAPDGLSAGSAYTANHSLHGTLGNSELDGFWHELRNPVGVVANTGTFIDLGAANNGLWLPNANSANSAFALHPPGDTHPANRAWEVSQQGALRQSFNQYLVNAEAHIRAAGNYQPSQTLTDADVSRARAKAYQQVASRDVVALQNFQAAGLASEYDPAHPDRPFQVLHEADPRLARANAARAALGQPPLVLDSQKGLTAGGQTYWTWDRIKQTSAARLGLDYGEAISGNMLKPDRIGGTHPLDPRRSEGLTVDQSVGRVQMKGAAS
jgi:hypothetical protein